MPRPYVVLALLSLAGAFARPATAEGPPKGDQYAFLVGCSEYDAKELRPLEFTRHDVADFADVLKKSGWRDDHIVLLHDKRPARWQPEGKKIREELGLLLAGLGPDDSVVVALSGHGIQFKGEKKAYFCPIDARLEDRDTLVSLEEVYRQLGECKAGRKLLLVDACRNDPQSKIGKGGQKVDLESVTRPQGEAVPKGIVALFSCDEGQESFEDPDLGHGIFFYHVLQGWKGAAGAAGAVTLDALSGYVRRETTTYARVHLKAVQSPVQKGEFSGEWLLAGSAVRPPAEVAKPGKPEDPAAATEALKVFRDRGAKVRRDKDQPGEPVVEIALPSRNAGDQVGRLLKAFPQLQALNLSQDLLTDEGLKDLDALERLETLDLGVNLFGDPTMEKLAGLTGLKKLVLASTRVTDDGLKELTGLGQLQWLDVSRNRKITDDGMKHLTGLKDLQTLDLYDTGVTDEGLKELVALKQLRTLNLGLTGVTDEGVKELAALKQLESLDLRLTHVSAGCVGDLQKALPKLKVVR